MSIKAYIPGKYVQYTLFSAMLTSNITACHPEEDISTRSSNVQTIRSSLTSPMQWGRPFFTRTGVACYQMDTPAIPPKIRAASHFVCTVDLRWARIRTIHGAMSGDSFSRHTLSDMWNSSLPVTGTPTYDYASSRTKAVEVNLSFFNRYINPTQLSFPYKYWSWDDSGSNLLTTGTDCATHSGKVKKLQIWWDRQYASIEDMGCAKADFDELTKWGSAPDIIGGLDSTFDIEADNPSVARTFIGVAGEDTDRHGQTLLIYSGTGATQDFARDQLRSFGAQDWMMFDGGGSTELMIDGALAVRSSDGPPGRRLPNTLAVYAW